MKWKTLCAAVLAGIVMLAAGCGGTDKKPTEEKAAGSQSLKGKKLTMYVSWHEDTAKALAEDFKKATGAEVAFIRLPTGEAVARLTAEKDDPKADIWVGGPSDAHEVLKSSGVTEKYASPNLKNIPVQYRDKDGYWVGVYLEALAIGYNEARFKKEFEPKGVKPPTTLEDLLKPEFKGEIITPDPRKSGTGFTFIASLAQTMGEDKAMEYLKQMKANVAQYTPSGFTPAQKAGAGEYLITLNFLEDQTLISSKGQKLISTVYDNAGWTVCAMSKLKSRGNDDVAKAFFDYVLTKEAGAHVTRTTSAIACNPDVAPPQGVPQLKDMPLSKTFDNKKAGEMKKDLLDKFGKL